MTTNRRKFITTASLATAATLISANTLAKGLPFIQPEKRFDPWLEIDPEALKYNVRTLRRLSGDRPVLAVVKNNAYGLGLDTAPAILDNMPEVVGIAEVKTETCLKLQKQGIKKPILLMGMPEEGALAELLQHDVQIAIYTLALLKEIDTLASKQGRQATIHLYVDTGMSRMGVPHHQALSLLEQVHKTKSIKLAGMFTGFTEDPAFDREQLSRLQKLASRASRAGIATGKLHAASSNAIYHFPEAALDMVRPGIGLYGAYPTYFEKEKAIAPLKVAYRLKARVVRTQQLQPGDSVSYGRKYVAEKPTWIATLPIGHADGYRRNAVKGAKVLINNVLYPVIGAVSASHTIIEVGVEPRVQIGDEAILCGPDHPEIHPNQISEITGDSVYDVLMHLSAGLHRKVP